MREVDLYQAIYLSQPLPESFFPESFAPAHHPSLFDLILESPIRATFFACVRPPSPAESAPGPTPGGHPHRRQEL